jgi:hypothetical protein
LKNPQTVSRELSAEGFFALRAQNNMVLGFLFAGKTVSLAN